MSTILVKPVISEKAGHLMAEGKYVFEITPNANASEVKKEVSRLYNVKVAGVNIINLPSKVRRRGRQIGRTKARRKAVVTLVPGQSIEGITEPNS